MPALQSLFVDNYLVIIIDIMVVYDRFVSNVTLTSIANGSFTGLTSLLQLFDAYLTSNDNI